MVTKRPRAHTLPTPMAIDIDTMASLGIVHHQSIFKTCRQERSPSLTIQNGNNKTLNTLENHPLIITQHLKNNNNNNNNNNNKISRCRSSSMNSITNTTEKMSTRKLSEPLCKGFSDSDSQIEPISIKTLSQSLNSIRRDSDQNATQATSSPPSTSKQEVESCSPPRHLLQTRPRSSTLPVFSSFDTIPEITVVSKLRGCSKNRPCRPPCSSSKEAMSGSVLADTLTLNNRNSNSNDSLSSICGNCRILKTNKEVVQPNCKHCMTPRLTRTAAERSNKTGSKMSHRKQLRRANSISQLGITEASSGSNSNNSNFIVNGLNLLLRRYTRPMLRPTLSVPNNLNGSDNNSYNSEADILMRRRRGNVISLKDGQLTYIADDPKTNVRNEVFPLGLKRSSFIWLGK